MRTPSPIEVVDAAVSAAVVGSPWQRPENDANAPRPVESDDEPAVRGLDGSTVWCAAYPMVVTQHPRLPQSHDEHQTPPFGCVDLWVQVDAEGKLEFFRIEGKTLGQTLAALGRPDEATEADGLVGRDAASVADRLAVLLSLVLKSSMAALDVHPGGGGERAG